MEQSNFHIVIIGGGVAGTAAAEAALNQQPQAKITLISEGGDCPRADLLCLLRREPLPVPCQLPPQVERLHDRVVGISRENRLVKLAGGGSLPYDSLILATGSKPIRPDGVEWPQLITLYDTADVEQLHNGKGACVVLGGNLEAVRIAWALTQQGREVTLISADKRLLMQQLDRDASHFFLHIAEQAGVRVALNGQVEVIEPGRVVLADSRAFVCTQAVASLGRRSTVNLAPFLALPQGRSISVDDKLATACANVWAAGECTDSADRLLDPAGSAREMGRVAGINAAGGELSFVTPPAACHISMMGVELWRFGEICGEDALSRTSMAKSCLIKLFFAEEQLVGAESISAHPAAYLLRRAVDEHWPKHRAVNLLNLV